MARSLVSDAIVDAGSNVYSAIEHVYEARVTAMPGKANTVQAPDLQRAFMDLPQVTVRDKVPRAPSVISTYR
jgi:hypothetical protein